MPDPSNPLHGDPVIVYVVQLLPDPHGFVAVLEFVSSEFNKSDCYSNAQAE